MREGFAPIQSIQVEYPPEQEYHMNEGYKHKSQTWKYFYRTLLFPSREKGEQARDEVQVITLAA